MGLRHPVGDPPSDLWRGPGSSIKRLRAHFLSEVPKYPPHVAHDMRSGEKMSAKYTTMWPAFWSSADRSA
jgi:hypothetical protein